MTIYSILHEGDSEEAYSQKEFEKNIWKPFCQNAISKQGRVMILKENSKSRRFGDIIPYDGGLEILWYELEKEYDGAYGH